MAGSCRPASWACFAALHLFSGCSPWLLCFLRPFGLQLPCIFWFPPFVLCLICFLAVVLDFLSVLCLRPRMFAPPASASLVFFPSLLPLAFCFLFFFRFFGLLPLFLVPPPPSSRCPFVVFYFFCPLSFLPPALSFSLFFWGGSAAPRSEATEKGILQPLSENISLSEHAKKSKTVEHCIHCGEAASRHSKTRYVTARCGTKCLCRGSNFYPNTESQKHAIREMAVGREGGQKIQKRSNIASNAAKSTAATRNEDI